MINEVLKNTLELTLVHYREELSSTQDAAREIKAKPPYLVWAKRQLEGRGRLGRTWLSPDGGLYFTLVVRKIKESWALPLVSAYLVMNELSGLVDGLSLKWPNDILFGHSKLAGILAEAWKFSDENVIGIGVGVNVNQSWLSGDFSVPATSLFMLTGRLFDLGNVLRILTSCVMDGVNRLKAEGFSGFHAEIRDALIRSDQPVRFYRKEEILTGRLYDMSVEGNGFIETSGGEKLELSLSHIMGLE